MDDAALRQALTQAMSGVISAPAAAIVALDKVIAAVAQRRAQEASPAPDDDWFECHVTALNCRLMAARMLADGDEIGRTLAFARALMAGHPTHPFNATIAEIEAEQATDLAERDRLFDAAFALYESARDDVAAVRNRMRAATLAGASGHMDRMRACAGRAIALATERGLKREALNLRMQLYTQQLITDRNGSAREALSAELVFVGRLKGALPDALERDYAAALEAVSGGTRDEAVAALRAFGLDAAAHALLRAETPPALAAATAESASELAAQRDAQRLDLLLLASQYKLRLGEPETCLEAILPLALKLARAPAELCKVHAARADAYESLQDLPQARAALGEAIAAAAQGGSAATLAQARARLEGLSGDDDQAAFDPALDADDQIGRRIPAIIGALSGGDSAAALRMIDALPPAREDGARAQVLMLRGMAASLAMQPGVAEPLFEAAARLYDPALALDADGESDLLQQRENALLLQAVALTQLKRPVAAWECAERARAPQLRHALGLAEAGWPAVRDALARRRAAVLCVSAMRAGTLLLSAAPGEAEPRAEMLDAFSSRDMNRLLDADAADDSPVWNRILFDAIPELSTRLAAPLRERLHALAASADVLYLIPDSLLLRAPWAALEPTPGVPLTDLVPLSLLPFADLLAAPSSGAREAPRSALLLATGFDLEGYDFRDHVERILPSLQGLAPTIVTGDDATPAALLTQAARHELVYVACHGRCDSNTQDLGESSQLDLAGGRPLTASEVARADAPLGAAPTARTLTFLNACQSGRFRAATRMGAGGFPAAFLRAGRPQLIAPLTHVDPHAAARLAARFFPALLGGATPAKALQAARAELIAQGAPASDWAAHQMFGVDD